MKLLLFYAFSFISIFQITHETPLKKILSENWLLSIEGLSSSYQVTIPSTLTDDLVLNNIVSADPYYRDNFL